ncbi:dipicolinate synthase subunit B [Virgibacillus sp. MSP4-1]|uniref:dipicolinate synthase subunit B n=1 Tax=Virgibacillus sp. MSP4-1 TaxID=2700081 RepID=UPI00039C43D7|nr:dipicolinate synthase subunit B [Virgibacillus sp. MSP4-1]QHS22301.1 dipicolinate synthase subunit B [Virgibacillus sp. MSP4-1]
MDIKGKRIGFGVTGSHCTYEEIFPQIQQLVDAGAEVVPVISNTVKFVDSKFGKAVDHVNKIEEITGQKVISTIPEAEPLGPKYPLDCMVIAPLTGNSLSKLANALTDSPVLMAAKATMRNQNPIVLGVSTNDALGMNGVNLMRLMASEFFYFIPLGQDHPFKKPNSLVADMAQLQAAVESALDREQYQPVLIQRMFNEN